MSDPKHQEKHSKSNGHSAPAEAPDSHMGATENETKPSRPPLDELGEVTHTGANHKSKRPTEYDPEDEITPG